MKQRIFLGLAPLFILLVAMGTCAIILFSKLGNQVDVILRENFRSVLAGQQMKETAERMNSAMFFSLAGEDQRGRQLFTQSLALFEASLRAETNNITLPGEAELVQKLKGAHEAYVARADVFWETTDLETRRKMVFGELLPAFTQEKELAQEVVRINQENMVRSDRAARDLAARSTRYMIFASVAGIGGAIFFAVRLQHSILRPIQALTIVSKDLGEGKLDQVLPVSSRDEMGQLADTFNKMATKLRAYRQRMGNQVSQAQRTTEITFSALPDPIIALSADGRIDFKNPAASRFLAQLGEQHLPLSLQKEVEPVLQGGPNFLPGSFDQVLIFRVEEREIFMLPRVIGMRDETGHLFGAAVLLQDVTRLRLLDEVKTNLVSTVSHELKTPLTSVRMGLHLLLEERIGALNPKQAELLLAAREDSERLLRMINDLLDLATLESGQTQRPGQLIAPAELVQSARQELLDLVEARGMQFAMEIAPDLPPVSVDPWQIRHVFSNFISNAVKHSKAGQEILLQVKRQEEMVRFSIIDGGPGIPTEYQSQIFDRFFRVPATDVSGAGLGLAIAREIVQAQGGQIGLQNAPGHGCEFFFDLPILRA